MRSAIECFEAVQSGWAEMQYVNLGVIHLAAGDPHAAAVAIERADASLAAQGFHMTRSGNQALLAEIYQILGRSEAARAAIELSEQLGGGQVVISYARTHRVRARLALAEGDEEAAERWARSAVRYAFLTDDILEQGTAKLELARILAALRRTKEAASETQLALELYEAKGNRPGAADARALLDEQRTPNSTAPATSMTISTTPNRHRQQAEPRVVPPSTSTRRASVEPGALLAGADLDCDKPQVFVDDPSDWRASPADDAAGLGDRDRVDRGHSRP